MDNNIEKNIKNPETAGNYLSDKETDDLGSVAVKSEIGVVSEYDPIYKYIKFNDRIDIDEANKDFEDGLLSSEDHFRAVRLYEKYQ